MGMLIDGIWCADTDRYMRDGAFLREVSALPDRPVDAIADRLQEALRPVLVISESCPWSHRTALVRALKGLWDLPILVAGGPREEGYALSGLAALDPAQRGLRHIHQLYTATDPGFTGRATVPLLWDRRAHAILCNGSGPIARGLDRVGTGWRLAPDGLAGEIAALNAHIYRGLANGVYRAGFATAQGAYQQAVAKVFATLDGLEAHLSKQRCLFGQQITEADLFLFATLVRFDSVYGPLFRCTRRRLIDYPALWAYARDVFSWPGVAGTCDLAVNLQGYFLNDTDNNPHGIVPELPDVDWTEPHGRERHGALTVWQDGRLVSFAEVTEAVNTG